LFIVFRTIHVNLKEDPFKFLPFFEIEFDTFEDGFEPFKRGTIKLDPKVFEKHFNG